MPTNYETFYKFKHGDSVKFWCYVW